MLFLLCDASVLDAFRFVIHCWFQRVASSDMVVRQEVGLTQLAALSCSRAAAEWYELTWAGASCRSLRRDALSYLCEVAAALLLFLCAA